jgi:cytochrome c biogenesis protein CcmG/thiol:disulfide interchange protein DsbE
MTRTRLLIGSAVIALGVLLVIGLVQLAGNPSSTQSQQLQQLSMAQMQAALVGSPRALAALHNQANQLLDGGRPALGARLKTLHGEPLVLDKWASWCEPCQAEFGLFQHASVNLGHSVAFIGIDSSDPSRSKALAFLRAHPVSYPSYYDPSGSLGEAFTESSSMPVTVFYNRDGSRYIRQGAYPTLAKLEADVKRYALDS